MDLSSSDIAFGSVLVPPGSLPFALFHGEALVACAAWALGAAEVDLIDDTVTWEGLLPAGDQDDDVISLVLHDAMCPALGPDFIAECVAQARVTGRVVAGSRPVTDTVKDVRGGLLGATVDRDALTMVTSPVVLPPAAVAVAARLWPGGPADLPTNAVAVVNGLAAELQVEFREAPVTGRRVASLDDVRLLEALTLPDELPTD